MSAFNEAMRWIQLEMDQDGFACKPQGDTSVIATKAFNKGDFLLAFKEKLFEPESAEKKRKQISSKTHGCLSCKVDGKYWSLIDKKTLDSLASCVAYGCEEQVNCKVLSVKSEDGAFYACIFAKREIDNEDELMLEKETMSAFDEAMRWIHLEMDQNGFICKPQGDPGVIATKAFKKGDFLLAFNEKLFEPKSAEQKTKQISPKTHGCLSCKVDGKDWRLVYKKTPDSLASCVNYGSEKQVNCEVHFVKSEGGAYYACIFAKQDINKGDELMLLKSTEGIKTSTVVGICVGGVAGVGAVVAAPFILTAVGFTSAGIAAGSIASGMMSSAAIANGGGVAAGSLVAVLQSAGAVGFSATASAAIGGIAGAVGGAFGKLGYWLGAERGRNNGAGDQAHNTDGNTK